MPKSIAIFGAGPALGRAVAHRYAREGYAVALVARRPGPLEDLARELISAGADAKSVAFDLAHTDDVPRLAEEIRGEIGAPDAIYFGASGGGASPPPSALAPDDLRPFIQLALYTLVALVHEFLPPMIDRRDGAVLVATGASGMHGMPNFSVAGPAMAAQRNYLQSLEGELGVKGVYVGRLYIGATIEHSAWHARIEAERAAGRPTPPRGPIVDPAHLADLLWNMHDSREQSETVYPEGMFGH